MGGKKITMGFGVLRCASTTQGRECRGGSEVTNSQTTCSPRSRENLEEDRSVGVGTKAAEEGRKKRWKMNQGS